MQDNFQTRERIKRNRPIPFKPLDGVLVQCSVKIEAADIERLPPENAKALLEGIGRVVAAGASSSGL